MQGFRLDSSVSGPCQCGLLAERLGCKFARDHCRANWVKGTNISTVSKLKVSFKKKSLGLLYPAGLCAPCFVDKLLFVTKFLCAL